MLEGFEPLEHGNTDFADVVALGHLARAVFDRGKATRLRAERILESSKACQLHSEFLFPAALPLPSVIIVGLFANSPLRSSFSSAILREEARKGPPRGRPFILTAKGSGRLRGRHFRRVENQRVDNQRV